MKSHENCSRKELEAYIGIEAQKPFFSKALDIYTKNPNTPIWNFAAFFLNIFWFMYRKSLILSAKILKINIKRNYQIRQKLEKQL